MVSGSVENCNFIGNNAHQGGAIYFDRYGNVTTCNFADNSASDGGAIFSYLWYTAADTCIFKTGTDTINVNTVIRSPTLNVDNFTTWHGYGEKLTFDLKTYSGIPLTNGNISISIYFKDNDTWICDYSYLSGEEWIPNLPVGSYYAIFNTEYAEFNPINRTITIKFPAMYYIDMISVRTNNTTVNITAESNIPENLFWDAKLLFVLPNTDQISANYGGNGTWWAVYTFEDYGEYDVTASYTSLDNIIIKNTTITIKPDSTLTVGNIEFDYGSSGSVTVTFTDANGVNAYVVGHDEAIVNVNGKNITVSNLNAGNYTLTVTTIADANHNNVTKTANITVKKIDSTLTIDNIVLDYGEAKNVTVITEGTTGITAKIDNNDAIVNKNTIIIPTLNVGNHTLTVTTIADTNHNNITKTVNITINKVDSTLTIDNIVLDYGEAKNVTVITEGTTGITAKIDNNDAVVNKNTIIIPTLNVGNHTLTVTAIADTNHNNITKTVNITINKVDSTLTIDNIVLDYGEAKNVTVITEGTVNITAKIDNDDAIVNENTIVIPTLNVGNHTLTVTTIADDNHNNVTKTVNITVNKLIQH